MLLANDWLVTATTTVGLALVFGVIGLLGGTKWFPKLPAAVPGEEPTFGDRVRYYAANMLALAFGVAVGVALAESTRLDPAPHRYSVFDGGGRWIGPLAVAMGTGCWLAMVLMDRMVAPARLAHILHRANRRLAPGVDLRPSSRKFGVAVALGGLLLHFGMRDTYTMLTEDGVVWRDWPWQEEQARRWRDLRDVRIVRLRQAPNGSTKEAPHLGLEFADGTLLHVSSGFNEVAVAGFWEEPAAFVAAHSGLTVRRVERD